MNPLARLFFFVLFFALSVFSILLGICVGLYKKEIYATAIDSALRFKPGSIMFNNWIKTPFDVYFDIYYFNWTNPQDFHNPNVKPAFEEIGPIRYLETMEKTDINFHENDTVTYNRTRRWFFHPEGSKYTPDVSITTINPVAVSAGYTARDWSYFMRKTVSFTLNSFVGELPQTKTVGEMIFDGYYEPLVTMGTALPLTNLPPMDKFAWFYTRNGSSAFDGHFTMGLGGDHTMGSMDQWNHRKDSPFYEGKCGEIVGSAGEFFPQHLSKEPLGIFNSEICRTLYVDFEKENEVHGVNGYRYVLGDSFFDNGTKIPGNECYCTGECLPYGAVNISSCRYGAPGFVSLPHFYKADPIYKEALEGMHPTPRHEFSMTVEPITGLPLEVAARLQMNILVQEVPGISLMERPTILFPILWFEEVVKVPFHMAFLLKILLSLEGICLFIGAAMVLSGLTLFAFLVNSMTRNIQLKKTSARKASYYLIRELMPLNTNLEKAFIKS